MNRLSNAVLAAILALAAAGCSYDYTQRTDRVAYSAGNAVRANIERETINPSSRSMSVTTGLGRNGIVTTQTAQQPAP